LSQNQPNHCIFFSCPPFLRGLGGSQPLQNLNNDRDPKITIVP
jgi:hypothetical protein